MQVINTLCDLCMEQQNQKVEADEAVVITVNRNAIEVDLCQHCRSSLDDYLALFYNVGRRPDTLAIRNPKPKQRRGTEQFDCEVKGCDRSFDSLQGLSMHNTRTHGNAQGDTRRLKGENVIGLKANRAELPEGMTLEDAQRITDGGGCIFDAHHGPFSGRGNVGSHLRQAHGASLTSLGLSVAPWTRNLMNQSETTEATEEQG